VLLFEGVPSFPDFGRYWQVIEKYRVNTFYTAPTALRALMKEGDAWPASYDLSCLRILGTVGEPIKAPEWHWYFDRIGGRRCPIVDTWWQTETGGICISPLPAATPTKPGSATLPLPGIRPVVLDERGNILEGEEEGNLCIAFPWPGMARTLWGDHERFKQTYFSRFPGFYTTGDGCRRDRDGYYWITGRVDDMLTVSGHTMGTAEIEGAIGRHPAVAEAAVVGVADEVTGEHIVAFVTLRTGAEAPGDIAQQIGETVRSVIGPHAVPKFIQLAPALPKTRSGKIMRRLLRLIASGNPGAFGDTSTLADATVLELLRQGQRLAVRA
jgi:acetyl-CoA synthetase